MAVSRRFHGGFTAVSGGFSLIREKKKRICLEILEKLERNKGVFGGKLWKILKEISLQKKKIAFGPSGDADS